MREIKETADKRTREKRPAIRDQRDNLAPERFYEPRVWIRSSDHFTGRLLRELADRLGELLAHADLAPIEIASETHTRNLA